MQPFKSFIHIVNKVFSISDDSIRVKSIPAQQILFAPINATASGPNELVAASTGKKIKVLHYTIIAEGDVAAKFQSDSTDLTGAMKFSDEGGISTSIGTPDAYLFETAEDEPLNLNLSVAVAVRGHISYFLEA